MDRNASAGPDVKLNAEILSDSRVKGVFAGVSLDGAVVQTDESGDKAMYGDNVDRHEILDGKIAVSAFAKRLLREIDGYAQEAQKQLVGAKPSNSESPGRGLWDRSSEQESSPRSETARSVWAVGSVCNTDSPIPQRMAETHPPLSADDKTRNASSDLVRI